MDFSDVVFRRRMVRSYDPDRPVPRDLVSGLLSLAVRAPSAGHTQGWQFLVLDDITSRYQFWDAATDADVPADAWLTRLRTAPVLVVCLADREAYLARYAEPDKGSTPGADQDWAVPYWDVDTGMAALLVLLGAVDAGLGACFFGVPGERWPAVRVALDIPDRLRFVGVVSLGYPAPDLRSPSLRRGRRPLRDVVSYRRFGRRDADGAVTAGAAGGAQASGPA